MRRSAGCGGTGGAWKKKRTLRADLQEQESRAVKTTAALTGMPGGGGDGQTLARAVESIVEAQQKLQAQINVCGAVRREVVAAIDQVQDERDHTICTGGMCWGSGLRRLP